MSATTPADAIRLEVDEPIWDRFFTVAPLVLIGTRNASGVPDLAPKHMVTPLGWDNYFGFVCSSRHKTWRNIVATEKFTVSYTRPDQLLYTSLAASPRCEDGSKPIVSVLDTFDAPDSGMPMLSNAYLWLDCELERIVTGFGPNGLIAGHVVAAHGAPDALRHSDLDAETHLAAAPLFAYVHPGRFSIIDSSHSFPFPADMQK